MEDPITLRCDDSDTESFQLDRQQVRSASRYLSRILAQKRPRTIVIRKTRHEALEVFCRWAQAPKAFDSASEDIYMQEPWLSNAAAAWILGQGILAEGFQRFCLRAFIKNCALAPFGPWKEIEEHANDNSPLARFSNHWIAWIFSTVQGVPQEFEGLRAVARAKQLIRHIEDPRVFDQDHWYSTCGDQISPHCPHHPKAKEKRTDEEKPRRKASTTDARELNSESKESARQPTKLKKSRQSRLDSRNSLHIDFQRSQSRSTRSHQSSRHSGQSYYSHEYVPSWGFDWGRCREFRVCRWVLSSMLVICLTINLALCIDILAGKYEGANVLIISYSVVCVSLGVFCCLVREATPGYLLCTLIDGIVMTVDIASCCEVADSPVCVRMSGLTVFVWLSLPLAYGHRLVWDDY